ncbi:penicillin-binding protein activator [Paraglaciecola sp.]|uniref:penicillin-binding protein activator n=1 Tax=Paraglaciecola sp. TaxID=1920173 RepID=UPI00273FB650|nr:penicillin-binding protein activator [Paraglaciecola sp.]MDP5032359.1 penicillin-binding protein activator [Paraglaciecola sp.]
MVLPRFLSISLISLFIVSCSSPTPRVDAPKNTHVQLEPKTEVIENVDYLQKAELIFSQTGSAQQRDEWLLKAADSMQKQGDCVKSLALLKVLAPQLQTVQHRHIAHILSTECLVALNPPELAEHREFLLEGLTLVSGWEQRVYALQAQLYSQQQAWVKASEALLKTGLNELEKDQQIWQWLKNLSVKELRNEKLRNTQLQPWLQLSLIVHTYGLDPSLLAEQLVSWQSRFGQHSLASHLPVELSLSLEQKPIEAKKIAVLLPLSGRLANQGLALKEGILAAYLNNIPQALIKPSLQTAGVRDDSPTENITYRELHFFDSALKTPEELNDLVADYDFVLGPLLKENISGLTSLLAPEKVMLALNRTENEVIPEATANVIPTQTIKKEHYFYALAPEDEAEQLAQFIKHKGYKRPIIFTADNNVTSRMTEAFMAKWMQDAPLQRQPDIAVFADSKDMREQVESLLDVAQSKARIKQMENIADIEVFSVERNRKDIDVIVLFANPEQTELLNPIIEASLSPSSASSLAVFASSRSYSLELSKNSLRDLRNLTFIDMPWMLPGHQWTDLANQTNALWPQRLDSLLRLFAMGFDSYELIDNLRQLKTLPQLSKKGLTGELSVTDNGVLHRHLPLAQITQDRVSVLAMD